MNLLSIVQRMSLVWRRYTPTESSLIEAVLSVLGPDSQALARQQYASVNRVQRLLDWTEVSFFAARWGKVHWPVDSLFPNRGEFELATFAFSVDTTAFQGSLWCVSGHIFSLVVRPSIKLAAFGNLSDIQVKLVGNPMSSGLSHPQLASFLPASYLAFCEGCIEDAVADWRVAKPEEVHLVHLAAGNFVFLAQRDADFLLANGTAPSNRIYFSAGGEEPVPVSDSFGDAMAHP